MTRAAAIGALAALCFLLGCTTESSPSASPVPAAGARSLQIYVAEPGVYRLTRSALAGTGLLGPGFDLAQLHLLHHSTEIPLDIRDSAGDFSIYFYASPVIGTYNSTDAYSLSLGSSGGARIASRSVDPPRDALTGSFSSTVDLEENKIYSANAFEGNHWFWQSLSAPVTRTITATVSAPAGTGAALTVSLAGSTEGLHQVQLLVNGAPAGEARWEGQTVYTATTQTTALRPGDNTLTLRLPGVEGDADVLYLDALSLTYQRELVAAGNALAFTGGAASLAVSGFATQPELYDVSDSEHPQRLTGAQLTSAGGAWTLAFYDNQPARRYAAFSLPAARDPVSLRLALANTLRALDQQADYLMLAPAEFGGALQRLAAYRAAHGLTTKIVDINQVYDAFGDGVPDPHAIRDFLAYARDRWTKPAPRFVLLVGKASYDYHDYLKGPNKSLLPVFLLPTPHLGEAASDDWYVAAGPDDIRPTVALGRIPAKTVARLNVAIDKIVAFESAPTGADWSRRALFVADDKTSDFAASADTLAAALSSSMSAQKVYLAAYGGDVVAARAPILRQWSDGAGLITYVGHGSIDTWAAGPLFGSDFLGDIHNGGRLPVLLTPTCLDGFFYHPLKDSLAESLLFKPDGGMIAGLVPTGLSLPEYQDKLTHELFAQLFDKQTPTLGEAVMRTKQLMSIEDDGMREVLSTFEVMGDPALSNPFR